MPRVASARLGTAGAPGPGQPSSGKAPPVQSWQRQACWNRAAKARSVGVETRMTTARRSSRPIARSLTLSITSDRIVPVSYGEWLSGT
jgi:hypothetical protein